MINSIFHIDKHGKETEILRNHASALVMVQDIYSPVFEGILTVESQDDFELNSFEMGSKIKIKFLKINIPDNINIEPEIEPIEVIFPVHKVVPHSVERTSFRSFDVYFTLKGLSELWSTQKTGRYYKQETFDYIITDLFRDSGVNIKFFDEYTDKIDFTPPLWSPIKSALYLSGYTKTKTNAANILFIPNFLENRIDIVSMEKLFNNEYTKGFSSEKNPISYSASTKGQNVADILVISKNVDIIPLLSLGIGKNNYGNFNLDNNKLEWTDKTIKDINLPRLSKYKPFTDDLINNNIINHWSTSSDTNVRDSLMLARYTKMFSDLIEMKAVVPGTFNRNIGSQVYVNYPKQMADDRTNIDYVLPDRKYSGKYIIRTIVHSFNLLSKIYKQEITMFTDGFNDNDNKIYKAW